MFEAWSVYCYAQRLNFTRKRDVYIFAVDVPPDFISSGTSPDMSTG